MNFSVELSIHNHFSNLLSTLTHFSGLDFNLKPIFQNKILAFNELCGWHKIKFFKPNVEIKMNFSVELWTQNQIFTRFWLCNEYSSWAFDLKYFFNQISTMKRIFWWAFDFDPIQFLWSDFSFKMRFAFELPSHNQFPGTNFGFKIIFPVEFRPQNQLIWFRFRICDEF